MAVKTVIKEVEVVTCDVDGCENEDASPLPFKLGGKAFDLCASHKAQTAGKVAAPARSSSKAPKVNKEEKQERLVAYNAAHPGEEYVRYTSKIHEWWTTGRKPKAAA